MKDVSQCSCEESLMLRAKLAEAEHDRSFFDDARRALVEREERLLELLRRATAEGGAAKVLCSVEDRMLWLSDVEQELRKYDQHKS
jgi:hypothetical protein